MWASDWLETGGRTGGESLSHQGLLLDFEALADAAEHGLHDLGNKVGKARSTEPA